MVFSELYSGLDTTSIGAMHHMGVETSSRDWLSIIPNCPKENIILIDRNKGILQCCNKKLLEKDYPFMVFRQKSSGIYKICEDRFISNTLRMLLNIFVKN